MVSTFICQTLMYGSNSVTNPHRNAQEQFQNTSVHNATVAKIIYWERDIDIFNGGMHCREIGGRLKVYSSVSHVVCPQNMLPRFGRTKSSPHLL